MNFLDDAAMNSRAPEFDPLPEKPGRISTSEDLAEASAAIPFSAR
jgi:hypothetical protein